MSKIDDDMPTNVNLRMGDIKVTRGYDGDKRLIHWDAVNECLADDCPISEICPYYRGDPEHRVAKCRVQLSFTKNLVRMIYRKYPDLDEEELFQIGTQLIPMYKMLSRLYIIELGVLNPVTINDRGTRSIHPVFREIREQIKSIAALWKLMGLKGKAIVPDRPTFHGMNPNQSNDNIDKQTHSAKQSGGKHK